MQLSLRRRQWLVAYTFLLLPLIFFLAIRIAPTLYALYVSLHEWDPIDQSHPYVGLENYRTLFQDHAFRQALANTGIYVLVGVPGGMLTSLLVAVGLERITRFRGLFRMLYFVPYVTSLVAVSWVWRWMYAAPNGVVNEMLGWFHLPAQPFLNSTREAIYAIIFVNIWYFLGFQVIIWLAGLQSIPDMFYEAAEIDGAGAWAQFRHITLPLLNPTIVFLAVLGVINSLQVFTQVQNMSGGGRGGPLNSTLSVVLYAYIRGFGSLPAELGYASAVVMVLFALILVVTLVQLKVLQRRYEY